MADLFGDEDMPEEEASEAFAADAADAAASGPLPPRDNPELIGHEAAEAAILADYNAGRMPHALILSGPPGIGKATLAFRIARFLFAQGQGGLFGPPESLRVAPSEPVFRRVASGGHADLLVVEREYDEKKERLKTDISVDSVRAVAPFLRKTAAEDGWRAVIVDGAESLNTSSQNALLKILEEPPPRALLILSTSRPGALLPTIRSRCRLLRLEAPAGAAGLLARLAPAVPEAERALLLELSSGSIGQALKLHAEGGLDVWRDLSAAAATLPELDTALVYDLAEKTGRPGAEAAFESAREILLSWCARAARGEARGNPSSGLVQLPPGRAFGLWEKMREVFRLAEDCNLDKRLALVNAFLLLQNPDHAVPAS